VGFCCGGDRYEHQLGIGSPAEQRRNALRILVADNHPDFREFLKRILLADPAVEVVGQADDGEEALQLAALLEPEVVLIEMEMPRLQGVEAARQLKERRRQTRVILMSLLGDEAHRRIALDSGADGFVAKLDTPVSEFLSVIRGGAGRRRAQRDRRRRVQKSAASGV
jgi:two-component system, NarL family, response regulator NreC